MRSTDAGAVAAAGLLRRGLHCFAAALSLILLPALSHGADKMVLRAADTQPGDYPTSLAVAYMGELLERASGGALSIKLYPGGQLGEEKDTIEITIFGGIDLNRINMAPITSIAPQTAVLGLPFLFRSKEHMRAVVDGPIGDEILAMLEPHGLIGLAFYDSGARSFYNSLRPIRSPDDMRGMKIRVQNAELAVAMVEALGANPTPMGFGQVYESLLLGTIDGSENNWPSYESTGHFEAAPHYTLTRHTMMPEVLVMSGHRWQKLDEGQRALVRRAARDSVAFMRQKWDQRVQVSQAKVRGAGVQVVDEPALEAFQAAMTPVYEKFAGSASMRELVARIRAVEGD